MNTQLATRQELDYPILMGGFTDENTDELSECLILHLTIRHPLIMVDHIAGRQGKLAALG